MKLSDKAQQALEDNQVTFEALVDPSESYQADLLEDYLSDAILMLEDFPEDAATYLEIVYAVHRTRRKLYTYQPINKETTPDA